MPLPYIPSGSSPKVPRKRRGKKRKSTRWATIFAAFAVFVSIGAVVVSVMGLLEQQRQWRATALGTLGVSSSHFTIWHTISRQELDTLKFGYLVDAYAQSDAEKNTGNLNLISTLIVVKKDTRQREEGIIALTIDEMKNKMLAHKLDPKDYEIQKLSRFVFVLKQTGTTPLKNVKVAVSTKAWEWDGWLKGKVFESEELYPDATFTISTDYVYKVATELPSKILHKITLSYVDADEKPHSREFEREFNWN